MLIYSANVVYTKLIINQIHFLVILKSLNTELLVFLKILYLGSNVCNQNFYSNFYLVTMTVIIEH